jgi:hypothetical protein
MILRMAINKTGIIVALAVKSSLVALPLHFPHLKFQHKKAYFRGKWQGCYLSGSWREHICSDPKISIFVWLKNFSRAAFFWLLYFLLLKKESLARKD